MQDKVIPPAIIVHDIELSSDETLLDLAALDSTFTRAKMFNLIVLADKNGWRSSPASILSERVFEYTADVVEAKFVQEGRLNVEAIIALPTIFMIEGFGNGVPDARLGIVTSLEREQGRYLIGFRFDEEVAPIPNTQILALAEELNLGEYEHCRTHWSIKEADLSALPLRRVSKSQDNVDLSEGRVVMIQPRNIIFYGPPGTGKTYSTMAEAVRLCGGNTASNRAEVMSLYRSLIDAGRIEFVTFHQSTSYEEFVEGLRPTQSTENGDAGFELRAELGMFRRIARRAETSTGSGLAKFDIGERQIWKMSIGEVANPSNAYLFEEAIKGGYTLLGCDDIDWSDAQFTDKSAIIETCRAQGRGGSDITTFSGDVQQPFQFRNRLKIGDIVIISKGNGLFRAIGEVTGDYRFVPRTDGGYSHRRAVKWLWIDRDGISVKEIYARSFSQVSIYRLVRQELNVAALERYIASQQDVGAQAPEPCVLIIDEINRANISKVFGELITLLEPDKRLGQPNEIRVRLPYSRDLFGVPSNLHIIGTMNTADRSIALLDTALRRRFEFRELMPDPSLLMKVENIDLATLLTKLNQRVEYLFDREHQIGHAYFIGCRSRRDLDSAMREKVIPLLAEYFYEDWEKIAIILGDVSDNEVDFDGGFLSRRLLVAPAAFADEVSSNSRYRWAVREMFDYTNLQ